MIPRRRNQYSLYAVSFVVLPLFLLVSCGQSSGGKQKGMDPSVLAEGYVVRPEAHTVSIKATGDLLPFEEVEIKAPVAGNVSAIHFHEGQLVPKGALLVEIDDRSWVAQKKGLEAKLISAENELQRKKKLLDIDGISAEVVEKADADVAALKAQIEGLDVMIDLAAVRAPFSGRLGMRNFSPGAYLSLGSVITRLVQTDGVKVDFTIPAKYALKAGIGQEVRLVASNSADTTTAVVYAVDPSINAASRSLQIRAMMKKNTAGFIPGDFAQVFLEVGKSEHALLIPSECIIPEIDQQTVFVVKNNTAKRQIVETGSRSKDRVEILSGLSAGDTILTTGLMGVREGSPIKLLTVHSPVTE